MALAALASEYFGNDRVIGFIVDHRLQDFGFSENTTLVQENLEKLGIRSNILRLSWNDQNSDPINLLPGKLMMLSREKRYRVLFEACKKEDSPLLLTGHNLEDDIVTMFYRASRLSGLDGLAGMKLASVFPFSAPESDSAFILRLFLSIPKKRLISTCLDRSVSWIHDHSNDDMSFRRNECLQSLIQLQKDNDSITTDSLSKLINSFKEHRSYIHKKGIRSFNV